MNFFQLYEGQGDIYLTGKNKYNPLNGNAFMFDNNNTNTEVVANRKKNNRKGAVVMGIALVVGLALGVIGNVIGEGPATDKTFTCEEMQITLNSDFSDMFNYGYDACYASDDVAVFVIREDFADFEGTDVDTLEEYSALILEEGEVLDYVDGIPCIFFDSIDEETNDVYKYAAYMYQSDDAFWLLQIGVSAESFSQCEADFNTWAKSVVFS